MNVKIDPQATFLKVSALITKLKRYSVLLTLLLVAATYGFLVWRIHVLANQEPSEDAVTEQVQTKKLPRIDQNAINKIQQLQDNSVDVKALFEQARNNPFQE